MIRDVRQLWRLLGAGRSLVRHNALFPLALLPLPGWLLRLIGRLGRRSAPGRPGERLARALQELGPAFIKLGQSLAVRDDLIGAEVALDLSLLHDRLPPIPGAQARTLVTTGLGASVGSLFSSFTDEPAAAASVAQVHRATTTEGQAVAVKVLRPGIERLIERDLDLLLWLAQLVERWRPGLRRYRPVDTVRTLATVTRAELDLRLEAAAAAELKENCAGDEGFRVPAVDWRRTSRRVITYEWVDGLPTDDRPGLIAAGHDPDRILERSARVFFNQVFRDGMFHGDMHPGNMLVDAKGDIVALDFGIMGRIDLPTRRHLAAMLLGFLTRDFGEVAEVFVAAGLVAPEQDRNAFKQAIRAIGEPILDRPLEQISMGRVLGQLLSVAERFEMRQRPDLILLQKTMVVAEGVGRRLNPNVNIWQLAQPLVAEWIRSNLGPEAQVRRMVQETILTVGALPGILRRVDQRLMELHPVVVTPQRWWPLLLFILGLVLGLASR